VRFHRTLIRRSGRTDGANGGAFLAAFIVSHLNAVFILGPAVTKADTTFLWASSAPVGLLPDAWNARLIPHCSLVFGSSSLTRFPGVLLAHRVSLPVTVSRLKRWLNSTVSLSRMDCSEQVSTGEHLCDQ
jgi:hypothetical protein